MQSSEMARALPSFDRWLPCYRQGAFWLAFALLCALFIGVSARGSESLAPLVVIPLGLVMIVWFLVLIGSSFWSAWRGRGDLRTVGVSLLAPLVSIAAFALVLVAIWWVWGVLPVPLDKTTDFQIDQILPSPDGRWLAVHDDDLSGGPATGVSQDVYLVRQRPAAALFAKDQVFGAECIQDFRMHWVGRRTLQIGYVVGDATPTEGLLPRPPLPILHDRGDELRFSDPVKVIEARRVAHGNLC